LQITPDSEAWVDALVSRTRTAITSVPLETSEFGLQLPINVADNPFLPEAVRAQYLAAGEPTFLIGRQNTDEGKFEDVFHEEVESFSTGWRTRLSGSWLLKARAFYGQSDTGESWRNIYSLDRFVNAVDAVLVNGTPTCRINALAMTDPACAPADIFGSGNMSPAAKEYFLGTIHKPLKTYQSELSLDVTSQPLSLWAGPVSLAVGANYREERARQFNDGVGRGFAFAGFPAFEGETRVTEAYAEAVVPLVRDRPFAKSMEADFAARWVDYSQSGSEVPWKLGLTWSPLAGLALRATRSEDIRAPDVLELNLPQFMSSISPQINPLPNGVPLFNSLGVAPGATLNVRELGGGNPALAPEIARTTTAGLVVQPPQLPGLTASLDYFRTRIDDAITSLPAGTIVRNCGAGDASQCALISMSPDSTLPLVATISVNAQSFTTNGLDVDVAWRFPVAGGAATLRALANYILEYEQLIPGTAALDLRGDSSLGLPALQGDLSVQFARGDTIALLSGTYIGSGSYRKSMSADIQNNHVPHVWYVGATIDQQLSSLCGNCSAYVSVSNLFDRDPPHPGFGIYSNLDAFFTGVPYDRVGRYFKVGLRWAL
jgi:outer membrane receptor protein involved in Fe transport